MRGLKLVSWDLGKFEFGLSLGLKFKVRSSSYIYGSNL